jgi:hypothetical protein
MPRVDSKKPGKSLKSTPMTVEERSLGEDVDVQKVGNNLGVPVLVIGQVAGHRRAGPGPFILQ